MTTLTIPTYPFYKELVKDIRGSIPEKDYLCIRGYVKEFLRKETNAEKRENMVSAIAHTVSILSREMDMKNSAIVAALLYQPVIKGILTIHDTETKFGKDAAVIIKGLIRINEMEATQSALASDSYINLLLSFAEDIRVIFIMTANRLHLMRIAENFSKEKRFNLCVETSYLYTPLAHKLGLYAIKTELEDLYLKYTDPDSYDFIKDKISESEASRNLYIKNFIEPIIEKLGETGLKYDVKGRVKSISSINNKLKKQQTEFESIYDLFAIRIILDSPELKEKADCWQAYSIVTDLYTPNPKRLKDWLSIPKSNGYESLHITVMGQQSQWVEVQIRTRRMDEIAEKGFAAHWKYKGVKSQSKIDGWLSNLRLMLESKDMDSTEKLNAFKLDLYDDEIYVFTPKGDLYKLPKGATILDFAFSIHSRLGSICVSGKVNDKNVPIRHKLNSGDQVEIITSPNQSPKQDWLNFAITSKARNKIRQSLKEEANKQVEIAKELLARRFKNRKIEDYEPTLMRLIKKLRFKTVTDFYIKIAEESLDIGSVIEQYIELEKKEREIHERYETQSAENYVVASNDSPENIVNNDELIIDQNLTGIEYKLAKCCNPIFGDKIFGFISSQGIKIHRTDCPNAQNMLSRFGYRVVPAKWSGKSGSSYPTTIRIIGNDDITIVNNLTSIIGKEPNISMRAISIDSHDGLFQGNITVMLNDTNALTGLIKKFRTVKGVKQVMRLN